MQKRVWMGSALGLILAVNVVAAEGPFKPYTLADTAPADVTAKLVAAGFEVAGTYTPFEGTEIIVMTSDALKANAANSERGAYGAVLRVAISGDTVSYTTPQYWANAFRLTSDLGDVAATLEKALGNAGTFGSKKGLSVKALRKYHYMAMMPHFDDPVKLGSFDSYTEAVAAVAKSLAEGKQSSKLVYRIDIKDKKETIFGIGMVGEQDGADGVIMPVLGGFTGKPEHSACLPYEILVSGGKVSMLHGKFRIALSFPDLSMGQFMKIRNAPAAIAAIAKSLLK